jgi:hypothetical protein
VVKVTGAWRQARAAGRAEPAWLHLKRSLANLAKRNITELTALVTTPAEADAAPARRA